MQELRLVGVAEDGANLLLADGDGGRFTLAISDELRTTIRRDRREPASADGQAKQENPLRPRDVQGLIRGGVPLEEIAERAGWSLEKVQRYEGPIRAERDYVSELAQRVQLFGRGEATTLRERADRRLAERGVEAERVSWDSWKNDETHWTVIVRFPAGGRQREATWLFDPVNRALRTVDDEARWLGGDEIPAADEDAPERQKAADRKPGRTHRDAPVYDVEAEGGLADAQGPHLGSRMNGRQERTGDLTASMRARQASRGRGKSGTSTRSANAKGSRATALPDDMTPTEAPERIDVGTTPPPLPSHPRPAQLREVDGDSTGESKADSKSGSASERNAAQSDSKDSKLNEAQRESVEPDVIEVDSVDSADAIESDASEVSTHEHGDDIEAGDANGRNGRGSRRRGSRRPRARLEQASVRGALTHDEDDQDESLFGELPGFHEGGDSASGAEDESFDEHDADDSFDDAGESYEDAHEVNADEHDDADGADTADTSDEDDENNSASTKGATRAVPQRASQTRKSSRPSVPSWDDIMFGGRGPKK